MYGLLHWSCPVYLCLLATRSNLWGFSVVSTSTVTCTLQVTTPGQSGKHLQPWSKSPPAQGSPHKQGVGYWEVWVTGRRRSGVLLSDLCGWGCRGSKGAPLDWLWWVEMPASPPCDYLLRCNVHAHIEGL